MKTVSIKVEATEADISARSTRSRKVEVSSITKDFDQQGQTLGVLQDVDLHAFDGELVSIIGPSGCGKSTLLNIIAGLDEPTEGSIFLKDVDSENRLGAVGYMQQRDLLMPWRTVLDNAIVGLELQGVSRSEARERATALLPQFGLEGFGKEYPHALSGGMKQRAAFLRTVLADQEVFLLDEPFGALDALTRSQIQEWLLTMWESLGKTIVLVTHDVDEAIFLSDRIYVMSARPGRIKLVVEVSFPRPRSIDILTSVAFVELKAKLLASLHEESTSSGGASRR